MSGRGYFKIFVPEEIVENHISNYLENSNLSEGKRIKK